MESTKMEILYETEKLKILLKTSKVLFKKVKDMKSVQSIMSRIRHLEVADNLLDFFESQPNCRIHSLKDNRKWEIAIDAINKTSPIRIIFKENHWLEVFITLKERTNLSKISSITILEISFKHYK